MSENERAMMAAMMMSQRPRQQRRRAGCSGGCLGCGAMLLIMAVIWFPWEWVIK